MMYGTSAVIQLSLFSVTDGNVPLAYLGPFKSCFWCCWDEVCIPVYEGSGRTPVSHLILEVCFGQGVISRCPTKGLGAEISSLMNICPPRKRCAGDRAWMVTHCSAQQSYYNALVLCVLAALGSGTPRQGNLICNTWERCLLVLQGRHWCDRHSHCKAVLLWLGSEAWDKVLALLK